MPLYSVDPEAYPGSTFPPVFPCKVVDGIGSEVKDCVTVETDTGVVMVHVRDHNGDVAMDWLFGKVMTVQQVRPLPISLVATADADEPVIVEG